MRRFCMSKIKKIWLVISIAVLIITALAFIRLPYVIESPGSAEDVSQFITVDGVNQQDTGEFRVLTVYVEEATVLTYLKRFLPHHELFPEKQVFGDYTPEEFNLLQDFNMRNARSTAVQVAFEAAGKSVETKVNGIFVTKVDPSSELRDSLKIGDLIETINGRRVENTKESLEDLKEYLRSLNPGDTISLEVNRDGESVALEGTMKMDSRTHKAKLGFQGELDIEVQTTPEVQFDSHGVSGPSGGLMFTLELYNILTNSHLKNGKNIAGTGTIEPDGKVGRIGGIDKKLIAAIEAGATIFLAPDDEITDEMRAYDPTIKSNYEEVKEAAEKIGANIKIYPVKTLQDAIDILKSL